jgi:N-acyl-D-amino-acid deacylase
MLAPPTEPVSRRADGTLEAAWYGCGWSVRFGSRPAEVNFWHTGSMPGTFSLLVRRHDHLIWALLFNQRSEDPQLPDSAIDPAMHRAAAQVTEWPERDLFTK